MISVRTWSPNVVCDATLPSSGPTLTFCAQSGLDHASCKGMYRFGWWGKKRAHCDCACHSSSPEWRIS